MNSEKKIVGNDLYFFPKYVLEIEEKEKNYQNIIQKNLINLEHSKETYEKNEAFGDYIYEYGRSLLNNGFLVEAGLILSCVYGSENWDNMFPYALLEKARIAAILEEEDFLFEFLRWAFAAEAYFRDSVGGKKLDLKRRILVDSAFEKYRDLYLFRQIIDHNYTEKELDEFYKELDD
ncbi:MAG: hypothetical protein ACFFDF_16080, partial [Candidatus Odinarchaeota archaeon]